MASWGKAFGSSALYMLCSIGWSLVFAGIMAIPIMIEYGVLYSGARVSYSFVYLIMIIMYACIFGGFTLMFLGTEAAYFKFFGEVVKDSKIDWGDAWKGAGKMYGWVILWILAAVGIILLGIFIPTTGIIDFYIMVTLIIVAGYLHF